MKKLIILGVVIIVAVITNPKKIDHVDAVKNAVTEKALEGTMDNLTSGSDFEKAGTAIGVTLGMKFLDEMLGSVIVVNNYLLFSTTKISFQGNERIIGVGAFGNVWLFVDLKNGLSDFQ
jgi:hypothetical protein